MSGNEAWNRNVSDADGRLTETGQRSHFRQAVPDGGSGDWEGPAADGRQFHGRYHYQQTIGLSRAEGTVCVCVRARQSALCVLHINRLVNHGHLQPTHTPNSHAPTKLIFLSDK